MYIYELRFNCAIDIKITETLQLYEDYIKYKIR